MRLEGNHASAAQNLPDMPGFMATTHFQPESVQEGYAREERRARVRAQGELYLEEPQTPVD